jgi:integrase/recombinase XerD
MKAKRPNFLALTLQGFFSDHLPRQRGMSPHTIHSYRDSISLLLRFLATQGNKHVSRIDIDDIQAERVAAFLQHLEHTRRNTAATRNTRLAAIHAFFRYVSTRHPVRLEQCQRILGVPFKRTRSRVIEYLEYNEIQAVLNSVVRVTPNGRRDYALLATMFNTGARVQEVIDIRPCDLQLVKPFFVRLIGKGRKERLCPLWGQTMQLLHALLAERGVDATARLPLFLNHRGEPLTRFGVRYILAKYCSRAQETSPTLVQKRLHPHSMRHSTAVHLLKSGVDMVTISQWLGHASVTTTNRYTAIDLETKRKAISKAAPPESSESALAPWRTDASILDWLESL